MHFEVRNVYNVSKDVFWDKIFFDERYNREAYLEGLGFAHFEIIDFEKNDDGSLERKLSLEPNVEIPDLLRKVIGQRVRYVEHGHFDPSTGRWQYRVIPSQVPDKVEIQGTIWLDKITDHSVERVCECDVNVRILGLGKMVEKLIVETTKAHYDRIYGFTQKYIAAHKL